MRLIASITSDVSDIMDIIKDAQNYLAELKIDQWQNGYPDEEQINLDIKNGDSYLVLNESNEVMGTTVFTTKKESTYQSIEGEWLTSENILYGVIHRLAVSDAYRKLGIAKFVFDECENQLIEMKVKSMRIDTHRENKGMQRMLKIRDYKYCGIIYLDSGAERLAFEKIL
jgi:ribosomal protein S18 acetylase RimI-like enzyme